MAPNILFLMTDQMQAQVLAPGHICQTPNLDKLIRRGTWFRRAYTSNAICSPARAGLMTGLLPHNHGVLTVTHLVDHDQCNLRTDRPHWAQRLTAAGYATGYFGKWHVERSADLQRFGWQHDRGSDGAAMRAYVKQRVAGESPETWSLQKRYSTPGYQDTLFYGVTDRPAEQRGMGHVTAAAGEWLTGALKSSKPWCAFVSVSEPHDPFVASRDAFDRYDVNAIKLPASAKDTLEGRPGLYRKAALIWNEFTEWEQKEAAACYYASITEIDRQFGRLLDQVAAAGQLNNTIVVMTADHGEMLGAHGLYCKNVSGAEEVYNIPMIVAGPQVPAGRVSDARVGLHELCPTLCELAGSEPITCADSRSFAGVVTGRQPDSDFTEGYAEYHGGRYTLTQRIFWRDQWKFVHNGFDFDELYNLAEDPHELRNLAANPAHADTARSMMIGLWDRIRQTGDHSLLNTHYPILRLAPVGPDAR